MLLGQLNNVKKYYGERLILDIDKFEVFENNKIGIVGKNGVGKSTLLKILLGKEEVDEGMVYLNSSYSYISQEEENILEVTDISINKKLQSPLMYKEFLSGGEKVKMKISKAIGENKKLIIADEPTANLDINSIKKLEELLVSHKGAVLLVSHDREFLDSICNIIVEIEDGKLTTYKGSYNDYINLKEENRKNKEKEYLNYINEKNKLENAIKEKEKIKNNIKRTPKRMGNSEARLHRMGGQSSKKKIDNNIKAIKSRIKHLEVKEKPKAINDIKINIQPALEIQSKNLIEIKDLSLGFEDRILINNINFKIKNKKKIALIGDNGSGKSTLLKAILKGESLNIKTNPKIVIGYFDQEQQVLDINKSILENIMMNSSYDEGFIRTNLSNFGFKKEEVYKKVSFLSGGEKVKVLLCKVLLEDNNLLILDEPTNYLDVKAVESLEEALKNTNKTIILVCHDRKFISNICDYILKIDNNKLEKFDGSYFEYEKEKNKVLLNKIEKENKEKLMILENKLSEILSLICFETDNIKKEKLNKEYYKILEEINNYKS